MSEKFKPSASWFTSYLWLVVVVAYPTLSGLAQQNPSFSPVKETLQFNHLTREDGLPSDAVTAIFQDSRGFMWFGTTGGHASNCTASVTVEDNVTPVAVCQNITVQLDASGNGTASAASVDNGSSDACGINLALSTTDFTCANVGGNAVALTVTDNNGNSSDCTATVTVEDNVAPVANCQDIPVQLDASGNASITTGDIDNGSSDACGLASLSVSPNTFDCYGIETHTVVLVATDNNGLSDNCSATVTVQGMDEDCDTVADVCDECPGGDDTIDNNNDGLPDCAYYPGFEDLIGDWKCANNKVAICHNGNTICVSNNAVLAHLAHGDYLGPCGDANCIGQSAMESVPASPTLPGINPGETSKVDFTLYPNPALDEINIGLEAFLGQAVRLVVYNKLGQPVKVIPIDEVQTPVQPVKVGQLAPGAYLMQVRTEAGVLSKAFLIIRD